MLVRNLGLILGVAAILVLIVACGGGSKGGSAPTPAPSASVAETSPSPTSSPAVTPSAPASPAATATPAPSATAPAVRALEVGMHALVGYDTIVYYMVNCTGCETMEAGVPWRAYLDADGRLHREPLDSYAARYPGRLHRLAADWMAGQLWALVCQAGDCYGDTWSADAKAVLLHSRDGGVSWSAEAHPTTPALPMAVDYRGEVLLWDGTHGAPGSFRWYPSGESVEAPAPDAMPLMLEFTGLHWCVPPGETLNENGGEVPVACGSNGTGFELAAREPWSGAMYAVADTASGATIRQYLPQGQQAGEWSYERRLAIAGLVGQGLAGPQPVTSERRLYGNADLGEPYCGSLGCGATSRTSAYEAVIFDLDHATIHPFDQLTEGMAGNENPVLQSIVLGPFRQVTGTGSCLNVRQAPGTPPLACYADGTILRSFGEQMTDDSGRSWTWVRLGNVAGLAASEYLR
ncbi:MAG: hypothetical protein IT303_00040 [Dehalococcoidia bacterium]|nr:hypothetical protein [Dehalococcoidia bacterium]